MDFIEKVMSSYIVVEGDINIPFRPIVINRPKPKKLDKKAKAPKSPSIHQLKAKPAKGDVDKAEKISFSELTNTRKLIPFIEKELNLTDPFNFTNETWARFIKHIVPKLLTMLLLDMHVVPLKRKAEFARYLERRLRTLAKT